MAHTYTSTHTHTRGGMLCYSLWCSTGDAGDRVKLNLIGNLVGVIRSDQPVQIHLLPRLEPVSPSEPNQCLLKGSQCCSLLLKNIFSGSTAWCFYRGFCWSDPKKRQNLLEYFHQIRCSEWWKMRHNLQLMSPIVLKLWQLVLPFSVTTLFSCLMLRHRNLHFWKDTSIITKEARYLHPFDGPTRCSFSAFFLRS